MDVRERLHAFWSGERPDVIPYTIYEWLGREIVDHPAWRRLAEAGMGMTFHIPTVRQETPGLEVVGEEFEEGGRKLRRAIQRTPVGEIYATWEGHWNRDFLLKSADDYRVMTWIARNTTVEPAYDAYEQRVAGMPAWQVPLAMHSRTPYQSMLVDLAGLEEFAYHQAEFPEVVDELYDALLQLMRRRNELIAAGPGRFVCILENFTAETVGAARFERYHMPVYEELVPQLHEAGKVVGVHYDGKTKGVIEQFGRSPVDCIESFTLPPEGDQTYEAARQAWPDKLFWAHVRVSDYQLPPAELRQRVLDMVEAGSVDGRRFAVEVSEHLPVNWTESLPVVLEALEETRQA